VSLVHTSRAVSRSHKQEGDADSMVQTDRKALRFLHPGRAAEARWSAEMTNTPPPQTKGGGRQPAVPGSSEMMR
jgi:hypothetical protein